MRGCATKQKAPEADQAGAETPSNAMEASKEKVVAIESKEEVVVVADEARFPDLGSINGSSDSISRFFLLQMAFKPRYTRISGRHTSSSSLTLVLTFVIIILLVLRILSVPDDLRSVVRKIIERNEGDEGSKEQWVEVISSWQPRAFVYHNFLTPAECDYLIDLAKPHMEKSTVLNLDTGKMVDNRMRTSSVTFFSRGQDEIIKIIEKKIANFTFLPVDHGEGLEILHYEVGQKYLPHYDFFLDQYNTRNGGQRIATVLMYLSDVEEGGETVFPTAKGSAISHERGSNTPSECREMGLSVKPRMGDALLFWNMNPDASLDRSSLHGGRPVIKGNKWVASKWIRADEYIV